MFDWLAAIILGLIEGLTEFIPVSSTGHLLLAKDALGLVNDPRWDSFVVLIQLGAILAVVVLYFQRLWDVFIRLPSDPRARRFAATVIVGALPAVIAGAFLFDFIKGYLFDEKNVAMICWALIIGGVILLVLERWAPRPRTRDAMALTWTQTIAVGLFQCLALIPGVSRSGSTIVGGLMMGLDRRAAAEFSFFMAIPIMVGASGWDLVKGGTAIDMHFGWLIAVGFVVAFVSGLFVVRFMLDFVSRFGFAPFAVWRIVVGGVGLLGMYLYR